MAKSEIGQNLVAPSADRLAEAARAEGAGGLPPVDRWDPPYCGVLDMRIARDGTWFYQGTPIGRPGLVRLFSTILKREGDVHYLVTPVEKAAIAVDDAPFVAVDFEPCEEDGHRVLRFATNVGDIVAAGPDHPLRVVREPATGEPAPYIHVRAGLEALIDRKSFYRLVDLGETVAQDGTDWFGVRSGGVFFAILPAAELDAG